MHAEIHVRSFLLRLPDVSHLRRWLGLRRAVRPELRRLHQAGPFFIGEEIPVVDLHQRQAFERPQIGVLPRRRTRIDPAGNAGRVIVDRDDFAGGGQGRLGKRRDVQPFMP
jgi:hypothetical protein